MLSRSRSAEHPSARRSLDADHYRWSTGQMIRDRYRIRRLLGDGTFGRVLEVEDCMDQSVPVKAVKVIRAVPRYIAAAKIEASVLQQLNQTDPENRFHIVRLYDAFYLGANFALVFEPLGPSLYDIIKRNDYKGRSHSGFSMQEVQQFAKQLLQATEYMHRMRITHTDLKPENILLQNGTLLEDFQRVKSTQRRMRPADTAIKVIDFGGATWAEDYHCAIISTRQYRAPEVVLGLQWRERADIWSLGCIFAELYTGDLLFPTHDDYEHLAMMEKVLGPLPVWMARHCSQTHRRYFDHFRLNFPKFASHRNEREVRRLRDLRDIIPTEYRCFRHLVADMLRYDPKERPRARELLSHEFFRTDIDCGKPQG